VSRSDGGPSTTYIETEGGVSSPSCSSPENNHPKHSQKEISASGGSWGWVTQGDLNASVVLVGDGRLGGISCTLSLSALESLAIRGYAICALDSLETNTTDSDDMYNSEPIQETFSRLDRAQRHVRCIRDFGTNGGESIWSRLSLGRTDLFTDGGGSAAVEVAIKMGIKRHVILAPFFWSWFQCCCG